MDERQEGSGGSSDYFDRPDPISGEKQEGPGGPPEWQPPTAPGGESPWSPPPSGYPQQPTYQQPGRTPGSATASLVLGIVGLVLCPIICSVLAIMYGIRARREIERDPSLGGAGTATAGYVLGIVGLALYGLFLLIWVIAIGAAS